MLCKSGRGHLKNINFIVVASGIFALAGCVSDNSPTPENMARNTAQTAPADLQLACASASATKFGGDSATVLPVSSAAVDGGKYQIILDSKGQRSTCLIDSTGAVLSVEKV